MKKPLFVLPDTISEADKKKLSAIGYECIDVKDFNSIKSVYEIEPMATSKILEAALKTIQGIQTGHGVGAATFGRLIIENALAGFTPK